MMKIEIYFKEFPENQFLWRFSRLVEFSVPNGYNLNKGLSDMKQGKFGLSIEDVSKQDTPKIDFNKYKSDTTNPKNFKTAEDYVKAQGNYL